MLREKVVSEMDNNAVSITNSSTLSIRNVKPIQQWTKCRKINARKTKELV